MLDVLLSLTGSQMCRLELSFWCLLPLQEERQLLYTAILKAWGIRNAGCAQDTHMAEVQKKGLVRASIDAISECVAEVQKETCKFWRSLSVWLYSLKPTDITTVFWSSSMKITEWYKKSAKVLWLRNVFESCVSRSRSWHTQLLSTKISKFLCIANSNTISVLMAVSKQLGMFLY